MAVLEVVARFFKLLATVGVGDFWFVTTHVVLEVLACLVRVFGFGGIAS